MSLLPSGFSGGGGGFYSHKIEQSLRFNDDDSAYLSWTPASAGNSKTWTWSGWVKRGNLGNGQYLFHSGDLSVTGTAIQFNSSDQIEIYYYNAAFIWRFITTPVYRDTSGWYHISVAYDSTDATASDRMKFYINGVRVTDFGTSSTISSDQNTSINDNSFTHYLSNPPANTLDGYLAEVHFIDGQALDATSFGEFKGGVWIPKAYTGTYGTNGFYLDFGQSMTADQSGNGNDWTANNLAASDLMLDSPTNNFAVGNVLAKGGNLVAQEGNLEYTNSSVTNSAIPSTIGVTTGKWYAEYFVNTPSTGSANRVGISSITYTAGSTTENQNMSASGVTMIIDGGTGSTWRIFQDGTQTELVSGFANGDVIGVAFDADAQTVAFYLNGTEQGASSPYSVTDAGSGVFHFMVAERNSDIGIFNFGQDSSFAGNKTAQGNTDANGIGDFYYAPPAGYLALCTANLEVPDAMNPALDNSPQDHFNTVLWTGDDASSRSITGVGFQPDLVWPKGRGLASNHNLIDVVRGANKNLSSNLTNGENTSPTNGSVTSFDSDGFTLGSGTFETNDSRMGYAAWNWKANGAGVSNTDGSITSEVSANTDAGFSIVTYTGDGTNGATVGHGLSQTPAFIVVKCRSTTGPHWAVHHQSNGYNQAFYLNLTNAVSGNSAYFQNASSSTFTLGTQADVNYNGRTYVAYCWAEVEGFSKFGSYTGNGSTDGTFVYCGFRPAFVMIKRTDVGGTSYNWFVHDSARDEYNPSGNYLMPNANYAEPTVATMDFLANGFKLRTDTIQRNASGGTFIFMAFSSNPFKFSTAV